METKFAVLAIAMLAILGGAVFAASSATENVAGTAAGTAVEPSRQEMPDPARIAFMKAVHEGDYAAVKELSGQYGVGGRMMRLGSEEMFNLRYQIQQKMDAGDYEAALELHKQMRELRQAQMKQMNQEMQQIRAKYGMAGMGEGKGMRGRGMQGGCPMAETEG